MGSRNFGPQLPEGKLEEFEVELFLKQPVSILSRDPNTSMEKYFSSDVLGSGGHEHPPVPKFSASKFLFYFIFLLTILCSVTAY